MINLHNYPAFGFESSNCKWGFNRQDMKKRNIGKLIAYTPVIGTLLGLIRVLITLSDKSMPLKRKCSLIVRGSIEFLSLGILLLIPDLIASICMRHPKTKYVGG